MQPTSSHTLRHFEHREELGGEIEMNAPSSDKQSLIIESAMTSFTTTTRIRMFVFSCKLRILLSKTHWDYENLNERKNDEDSGSC